MKIKTINISRFQIETENESERAIFDELQGKSFTIGADTIREDKKENRKYHLFADGQEI